MLRISLKKMLSAIFIFFLLLSPIMFIPSEITILLRYFFIICGLGYILLYAKVFATTKFHILIYMYFFMAFFSLIFSPYLDINLILSYLQFVAISFIIVNFNVIMSLDYIYDKIFRLLPIIICAATLYSVILIIFGTQIYVNGERSIYLGVSFLSQSIHGISQEDFGYSSFYNNPNIYGFYCMILLCYLLFIGKFRKRIYKYLSWACCILGIRLSNSRAIIYISFLLVIIFIFLKLKPKLRYIITPVLLIMAGIFIYILYEKGFFTDQALLTGRLEMWNKMLDSIKRYPIFGIGFSASTKHLIGDMQNSIGSHNSYLNILCENGIVGFIIFILMLISVSVFILKSLKDKFSILSGKFWFSVSVFLVSLPYAFFENQFMILEARNMLWLLCCLIIVYQYKDNRFIDSSE